MYDWILSSSVLITAVIALRAVFKGRISMRLRYGLWALVLIRLLIPGNFIPSDLSIEKLTLAFEKQPQVQELTQQLNTPQQSYEAVYQEVVKEHYEAYYPQAATAPNVLPESFTATLPAQEQIEIREEAHQRLEQTAPIYSLRQILTCVWIVGMVIIAAFLLSVNLTFARRLKRSRLPVKAQAAVPVFKSVLAETPCLFGLFHPVIYITGETSENPRALSHILAHESSHYYHKDHIWAFLRCICLVLHWYNPLVWLAVSLSKRDCELACDEATIARIGDENRLEYGKTLVDMTCIKRAPAAVLLTATTMLSDKKTLVHRIRQVAKRPKVLISAIIAVVILAAVAIGCTFTGAPNDPAAGEDPAETTAPAESTTPAETTVPAESANPAESTAPTQPEETYPSHTEFFGEWVYRSLRAPDMTVRTAIENLQNNEDILSVYNISISKHSELATEYAANWLSDGTADKHGFTADFLKNDFTVYKAYYTAEYADSSKSGMYRLTFLLIQEGTDGRWKIFDATDAEKYKELPSGDPVADSPWEYEPKPYAEAVIREALGNLTGKGGVISVEVLSIEMDLEQTKEHREKNADFIAGSDLAKKLKLTKADMQYLYGIYNAKVMFKCEPDSSYGNATWSFPFQMLMDPEGGGYYILSTLMPYEIEDPTPFELQLYRYRNFFDSTTPEGYIRQMALTSFYSNPSFVDLSAMFYNDLSRGQLTDAERTFLTDKGFELYMDVQSHTTDEINNALQVAFGIRLDLTQRTGLNKLTYYKDTDSYYSNHNDTNFPGITITRYTNNGDGTVDLYYKAANMYVQGYDQEEFVSRILLYSNGKIAILSNSLIGQSNEMTEVFPEAPQPGYIQPLPINAGLSDLVKPYWELGIDFAGFDTYYITIPQIYPFSQEAIDANQEIYDLFAKELKDQLNYLVDYFKHSTRYFDISGVDPSVGKNNGGAFYYGYTASYQNGILSIVVILDNTSSGRETYHTFNVNVSTGESGSLNNLVSADVIRSALRKAYEEMHKELDSNLDFYQENLKKTLSNENVQACTVSYAEDGSLQLTGWIYTIGSVDKVPKVISLAEYQ